MITTALNAALYAEMTLKDQAFGSIIVHKILPLLLVAVN